MITRRRALKLAAAAGAGAVLPDAAVAALREPRRASAAHQVLAPPAAAEPQRAAAALADTELLPPVRPGSQLGYVTRLSAIGKWPPSPLTVNLKEWSGKQQVVATPFLLVHATATDIGDRPLKGDQALHSVSLHLIDRHGHFADRPVAGQTYTFRCFINNQGSVGAYGGLVEFYIAQPAVFTALATKTLTIMDPFGFSGFAAQPGRGMSIDCPRTWTPRGDDVTNSLLVQVYDPFMDALIRPFDPWNDRHVGRRDMIPDFSGTWREPGTGTALAVRDRVLEIDQTGLDVTISYREEQPNLPLGGTGHEVPGSGTINEGGAHPSVSATTVEHDIGPVVTATRNWKLTLLDADTLAYAAHFHFVDLTDPRRQDVDVHGTMHRDGPGR